MHKYNNNPLKIDWIKNNIKEQSLGQYGIVNIIIEFILGVISDKTLQISFLKEKFIQCYTKS